MAQRRRGLGKGIGALIPDTEQEVRERPIDVFFGASVSRETAGRFFVLTVLFQTNHQLLNCKLIDGHCMHLKLDSCFDLWYVVVCKSGCAPYNE